MERELWEAYKTSDDDTEPGNRHLKFYLLQSNNSAKNKAKKITARRKKYDFVSDKLSDVPSQSSWHTLENSSLFFMILVYRCRRYCQWKRRQRRLYQYS